MSLLDACLAEIAPQYGLLPEANMVDKECCLTTHTGLAAVHLYSGPPQDIEWVGACLTDLQKRGVRGLGLLLKTTGGEYVAQARERVAYLTDYVPGAACDGANTFEVRAAGRLLGEVHHASEEVLYFNPPPATRVATAWRLGASERAAYWGLAVHKYRQAARGEALRQLLHDAEESLNTIEEREQFSDGLQVLSFAHLAFNKFVYVNDRHSVHLNYAHDCFVEPCFINLGELLLDNNYAAEASLHLLAAYHATHPLSDNDWQMLFAYVSYPHEWAQELDDMTRGRPILKGLATLERLQHKREWLEWLREHFTVLKRTEKGGIGMKSEEKRPDATVGTQADAEVTAENKSEPVEMKPLEPVETPDPDPEQSTTEQELLTVEKPKASITWKPFPRPLGAEKEEQASHEETEDIPE